MGRDAFGGMDMAADEGVMTMVCRNGRRLRISRGAAGSFSLVHLSKPRCADCPSSHLTSLPGASRAGTADNLQRSAMADDEIMLNLVSSGPARAEKSVSPSLVYPPPTSIPQIATIHMIYNTHPPSPPTINHPRCAPRRSVWPTRAPSATVRQRRRCTARRCTCARRRMAATVPRSFRTRSIATRRACANRSSRPWPRRAPTRIRPPNARRCGTEIARRRRQRRAVPRAAALAAPAATSTFASCARLKFTCRKCEVRAV